VRKLWLHQLRSPAHKWIIAVPETKWDPTFLLAALPLLSLKPSLWPSLLLSHFQLPVAFHPALATFSPVFLACLSALHAYTHTHIEIEEEEEMMERADDLRLSLSLSSSLAPRTHHHVAMLLHSPGKYK
jgi:hypothetical protein